MELVWVIEFVIGTFIGSFLNVCIYRLPREQSIVTPRSRCPRCSKPIAWYDNIPVLSYLALGGRCRRCRGAIHWRYPIVETLSGAAAVTVLGRFGLNAAGLSYLVFVWALITVSFIDLEFQIIPDEISLGGLALGVLLSLLIPQLHGTLQRVAALKASLVGALVGGGLLYVTGALGTLIFRKEAMGGGDVKLLAMAGSLLGWKAVTVTFFLAPVLAIGPGVAVLAARRSHLIPYGPFLSLALVVSLFAGSWLLEVSGLDTSIRLLMSYPWWGAR